MTSRLLPVSLCLLLLLPRRCLPNIITVGNSNSPNVITVGNSDSPNIITVGDSNIIRSNGNIIYSDNTDTVKTGITVNECSDNDVGEDCPELNYRRPDGSPSVIITAIRTPEKPEEDDENDDEDEDDLESTTSEILSTTTPSVLSTSATGTETVTEEERTGLPRTLSSTEMPSTSSSSSSSLTSTSASTLHIKELESTTEIPVSSATPYTKITSTSSASDSTTDSISTTLSTSDTTTELTSTSLSTSDTTTESSSTILSASDTTTELTSTTLSTSDTTTESTSSTLSTSATTTESSSTTLSTSNTTTESTSTTMSTSDTTTEPSSTTLSTSATTTESSSTTLSTSATTTESSSTTLSTSDTTTESTSATEIPTTPASTYTTSESKSTTEIPTSPSTSHDTRTSESLRQSEPTTSYTESTSTDPPTSTDQPTSTTETPETTAATPTSRISPDVCNDCIMKGGTGYMSHPTDCSRFVICTDLGWKRHATEMPCPTGLYWNQQILTCDHPNNVQCGHDICSTNGYKPMPGHCRGYWECIGGSAISKCCPLLLKFDAAAGSCVLDVTCKDNCQGELSSGRVMHACRMRSVPDDRFSYAQRDTNGLWVRKRCPASTAFSQSNCACSSFITSGNVKQDCQPELLLTFDNGTQDESGKSVYVKNNGVRLRSGVAFFDGKSQISIDRFSNAWFGQTLLIRLVYQHSGTPSRQGLLCNGNCKVDPSVYIGTTGDGSTEFFVKTSNSPAANFTVPMTKPDWQKVEFLLHDGIFRGEVNGQSKGLYTEGTVETRKRALSIGLCDGTEGFTGLIDEVAVFTCKPKHPSYQANIPQTKWFFN